MTSPLESMRLTRRTMIRTGAVLGSAVAFGRASHPTWAQEAATPFAIPDPQVSLPTDTVTFQWTDASEVGAAFWEQFVPLYQAAHPNITVEHQVLTWNDIQQVIPLAINNGNAPDVFVIPLNVSAAQAANEGWGAALDDVIPNFEEYKARFPAGSFAPGVTDFNGKTYCVPLTSNRRHGSLLLFNRPYLSEAGYDPAAAPLTFDEFRDAARKVTEAGSGEYYGLVLEGNQVNRFSNFVNTMARTAGRSFGSLLGDAPIDLTTGELLFTSDEHLAALELLLALRDDDVVLPGSMSLSAPEARARVPQGQAAMIIQGPWNISQWNRESPDFDFGVAEPPVSAAGNRGLFHVGPGGDNIVWVNAESDLKEIAADILMFLGSVEGQTAWTETAGVDAPAIFPEAQFNPTDDPETDASMRIFRETVLQGPDARVRNQATASVYQNIVPVQPDFGTVVQGIYSGQLSDPRQAMQDLQDAWNAEFDRAIEEAQSAGAKVSRDDWVFPNWDPTTDYTAEDYAAL